MKLNSAAYLTVLLIGIVYVLIIGQSIIIPLVLAVLIWFLVKELRNLIQKIPFLGKRMPKWLLNTISVTILYIVVGVIVNLLVKNIDDLVGNMATYEKSMDTYINKINVQFGINLKKELTHILGEMDFAKFLSDFLSSITGLLGNTFMIALYLLFILLEETVLNGKILAVFHGPERKKEVQETLSKISDSISSYISLKTLVSLLTGGLSYIILAIIGIDSPLFWAFLIFLLNFIPTIGSLIATIFPALMALLQFTDLNMAIIVLVAVGAVQVIVGNIVEPKVMGNSLNVSSLVVILALSFWGAIWGITGMVLSVPITVILIILFGQFESTKNIAILLSEKGDIGK